MFCGKCGNKTVEGNSFCTTCGQGLTTPSLSLSSAVPKLDQLEPTGAIPMAAKTVEGALSVSQSVSPRVLLTQPDGKPLYCRHSPAERTMLGADREHGSATCLGCELPYAPGSPNSGLAPTRFLNAPPAPVQAAPLIGGRYTVAEFEAAERAAKGAAGIGLVIFVVGIVITLGTYSAAGPGGGFVVAWGAIAFGGYRLVRGLYYLDDPRRLFKKVH